MIELCDRYQCTGCSSCYNSCNKNAISMVEDEEGFLIPSIDASHCVECGMCVKACPVLTPKERGREDVQLGVYAGYIIDEDTRQRSSSGGLFSAIAKTFFESKSDNKKYLVAAAFNKHIELEHVIVDSYDQITKMRGSKYVQSRIGEIYKRVKDLLKAGSEILFVGTPCQVAGLNSYLGNKLYDNLISVDLICHGTPSPKLFSEYIQKIGIKKTREYYDYWFRDFSSTGFFISSYFGKNRKKHSVPIRNHSYITAYLKGWLHRECCYDCKFNGIPRQADITIGDFWGIISGEVSFNGDRTKGISVLLANTDKGEQMVSQICDKCYLEPHTLEEAIIDNHNLVEADKRPVERDMVYDELVRMPSKKFMTKHNLYLPHFTAKQKLRIIIAKYYHLFIHK